MAYLSINLRTRPVKLVFALFVSTLLLLTGCTNTLTVSGQFPEPVLKAMPLPAALYLNPEFQHYRFEDDQEDREAWDIHLGRAQSQLMRTVSQEMFKQFEELNSLPTEAEPAKHSHIIISPELKSFQYTMPRDTSVDIYEVWMKYNIKVLENNGDTIADWIITAYGKTPSAFLQSNEEAMNQAIIMALRDLGASYSLGFTRTPEIKQWLNQYARTTFIDREKSKSKGAEEQPQANAAAEVSQ